MKLTKQKLYKLIEESMGSQYSPETERKIIALIEKAREQLLNLQGIGKFYPTIINSIYFYNKEEDIKKAIRNSISTPHVKKAIMNHYTATQRIAEILEEVNQYLVLLETLEIEDPQILRTIKGMLYMGIAGPTTDGTSHEIKLHKLGDMMDSAVAFMEDIKELDPNFFGKDTGFRAFRRIGEAFSFNYLDLKKYLDKMVWT